MSKADNCTIPIRPSNVVQFPSGVSSKAHATTPEEALPESSTVTAANGRRRDERKDAWRMAEAAVRYWRVRLDILSAIERAQRLGIPEGRSHPVSDDDDRQPMVEKWRAALVRQFLTPAPDANSVKWKQTKLASERDGYMLST
jgi:hypothetical protein